MKRLVAVVIFLLGLASYCGGQEAAPGAVPVTAPPRTPAEIFSTAERLSDIRVPGAPPFELKATFALTDQDGKSSSGEYSEIWIANDRWRREVSYGSYKSTRACVDGKQYLAAPDKPMDFGVVEMMYNLKSPVPPATDAAKVNEAWSAKLDHINEVPVLKVAPAAPCQGGCITRREYLFNPDNAYPLGIISGFQSVVYGKFHNALGKLVPYEMTIHYASSKRKLDLNISSLEAVANPPDEALAIPGVSNGKCAETQWGDGQLVAGQIVRKVQPIYPVSARIARASGTVVLHIAIGKDGKIMDLGVVNSPRPDLADSAMTAVRQYVYKPFLLNGEPVEVDGIISINYVSTP